MSNLENAIQAIIAVFEQYAGTDERKSQLSKAEFSELLKKELSSPAFKDKVDLENIAALMEELDKNADGEVNFSEFNRYIASLAKGCYLKKRNAKNKKTTK